MPRLILATLVLILTALMATPAHATQPITDPVTGKQLVFHNHVDTAHIMWDEPANTFDIGVVIGSTVHPAEPYAMRLGPDADRTGREVSRIRLPENGMLNFLGSPGDVLWNAPPATAQAGHPCGQDWAPAPTSPNTSIPAPSNSTLSRSKAPTASSSGSVTPTAPPPSWILPLLPSAPSACHPALIPTSTGPSSNPGATT